MINFQQNSMFARLKPVDISSVEPQVAALYVDGEQSIVAAKGMRDFVIFTNKRIIAMNVQGMTGKKRDATSLPYSKIQAWSVETAGTFDLDAELELWFSGLGKVHFEFTGKFDVAYLSKLIGWAVLS